MRNACRLFSMELTGQKEADVGNRNSSRQGCFCRANTILN